MKHLLSKATEQEVLKEGMKRHNNLFEKIVTLENLELASQKAARSKRSRQDVQKHLLNKEQDLLNIRNLLLSGKFKTSKYKTFKINDGKEREISCLPFYPDRIVHHAISNTVEPILTKVFTIDTYSCIKNRGIHKASYKLRKVLKEDPAGTTFCLKIDIQKFYPSVDNKVLKKLLRKKFKDTRLLQLLEEIIDSAIGLPIGNYLSQTLANFYLTYFDHQVKEILKVKHYFRYSDDMLFLSKSKEELHNVLEDVRIRLGLLNLKLKSNYQIFPVKSRGIDWVGYKHYHTHTLLRKSIKRRYIRSKTKLNYNSWLIHADTKNLRRKYEKSKSNN